MPEILIVGGVARSILNFRFDLIKSLQSLGYRVTAVTSPGKEVHLEKIKAAGIEFYPIRLKRNGLNPLLDLCALIELAGILRRTRPEILIAYTAKPVIFSGLCMCLSRKIRMFSIITGLGYAFSGHTLVQRVVRFFQKILYRIALRKSEVVFFQNEDDRKMFIEQGIVRLSQKTKVIRGSGVNLSHFYYSKPNLGKKIIFLMMARLIESKGIIVFADAAAQVKERFPQVEFILLGSYSNGPGSIDAETVKTWENGGIIDYRGSVDDVRPYIENCSVYVLPSAYREGIPRSILEAMAMGRAVITTDNVGCRETVVHGVNGYLIPLNNSKALAEAMEIFINNPPLIESMGLESRKMAEEKFDVEKVNNVILKTIGINRSQK